MHYHRRSKVWNQSIVRISQHSSTNSQSYQRASLLWWRSKIQLRPGMVCRTNAAVSQFGYSNWEDACLFCHWIRSRANLCNEFFNQDRFNSTRPSHKANFWLYSIGKQQSKKRFICRVLWKCDHAAQRKDQF